jgi:iron complex outermembrane receptor protein
VRTDGYGPVDRPRREAEVSTFRRIIAVNTTTRVFATCLALVVSASATLVTTRAIQAQVPTTFVVAGRVVDARTGAPLEAAVVRARTSPRNASAVSTSTAADGRFRLTLAAPGTLSAERAGYAMAEHAFSNSDTAIVFALAPLGTTESRRETARVLEGLTITAVRGGSEAPVAQTTLDRARLERDYTGQDVPLSLRQAPSMTAYSESGSLLNYSYFRLRGIDQSRINITLDGVPLNEPEDQQLYFSDFPDLASSVQSVQVQRGVGTSTYGQAAFGGSVNFASPSLAGTAPRTTVQLGGGSFGTARGTLEAQSGELPNRMAFYGRLSTMRSDGYREGATSAANAAFVSGGYFGDRDVVKLTAGTGLERNGQAYAAVPDSVLRVDPRYNPLAGVGDHYRESFATLNYTRLLSPTASAGLTAYGFDTRGFYDYPSGVAESAALRYRSASRWGGAVAAAHVALARLTLDGGAHVMAYAKDHEFDARPDLGYLAYANTGRKNEASAFAKASYTLGAATLFGDLQLRTAEFRYVPTAGYGLDEARERWTFVNPRAGLTLRASPRFSLFASYGTTGREPTRADLFAGADDVTPDDAPALLPFTRVRPEHVNDLEAGATLAIGRVSLALTAYDMRFRDEIARTGATTPLGYDIRANVGRSYRRGLELDGAWAIVSSVDLGVTAAVSRNRIDAYTDEANGVTYRDVAPILTPSFVGGHRLTWRATPWLALTADGRYQSRTFLAPTGDARLTTMPFYVLDGGARFEVGGQTLLVQGRNLLGRHAYPSGDVSGEGVPRYFILAPRSVDVTLRITR